MSWLSIHGPAITNTTAVARILGMKASVISWICVTAWNTLTSRPTTRPTSSVGRATLRARVSICMPRLMTTSWFTPVSLSVEALDQRAGDEIPSVHQDEEQDLEGQRD